MSDIRLTRLADVLVHYSTEVQPGQWVGVLGDVAALPALREVHRAVLQAGANPVLLLHDEAIQRDFLREASDEQLAWLDPAMTRYYDEADTYIRVGSSRNTRAMTNLPAARVQQRRAATSRWLDTRLSRASRGEMRWVGTWYPTEASAQEASMSLEEFEAFVYGATFCDQEDPIAAWRNLSAMQQSKVDWLAGKREIVVKGPYVDLTLSIEGRTFINSDGHANMPSGEIFTGPVEESVNGWAHFTYPSVVGGRVVTGMKLRFEAGKVVEASADTNEALLLAALETDPGARYLGEFAVGTNYGIQQAIGNTLFDEKIGGTIHMAIGRGYEETGSHNKSAVHWDMICDMRQDSTIHVDGELFYENGDFVVA